MRSFAESERLQRHVQFLYAHGAFYKMCNGNLLYHGAVPMTEDGAFAAIRFEGTARSGKQLFDYCDRRPPPPAPHPVCTGRQRCPPERTGFFVVSVVRQAFAAVWPQRHDDV